MIMKTLHTIYSTFAKHNMAKFLTVLTILFTLGVGSMLGAALGDGYEKVTDISTLSAGDRVVLYCDAISLGVTGANSNGKDATVAASDWVEYLVESATGGVYLKDENASNYIASPGSSNVFKYGTKAVCSVNANGVLKCNDRYLCYNSNGGTYYRMYASIGDYKPFYVYKVVTSTPVYNITVSSNDDSWGTANVSGNTITADPADCYQVKSGVDGYTIISGTATVTHDGNSNTLTVAASSDCSIQVNFEKKPVNTYIDNVQGNEEQELCGDHNTPTLADKPQPTTSTCEQLHWHFMGWVTEANKENPTDANIVKANTSVTANGTTYYAVWAKGGTTNTSKQYSFDITKSNFNTTSYAANNNEKTSTAKASDGSTMSVKWTSYQVMLQSDVMQWQKNTGYIYNSTDLGTINSVTVTSSAGSFTTYYGTSQQPSSNTTVGNGYFQIKVGNATGKTSKVTVTFTQGTSTTTYSDYITSCITETTVSLIPNGGTISDSDWTLKNGVYELTTEDESITLPTISRTGYTFGGWATTNNGAGMYANESIITGLKGETVKLYATWKAKEITITWNANGGTVTPETSTYTYDGTTITLPIPTRIGYSFNGWFTAATGGTPITEIGTTNKPISDVTYYAQWTEKPLTNYRTFCDVVCDAYSFHTGSDDDRAEWLKEAIKCFTKEGGYEHEWQIKGYIIPADEKFFVGNYGYFYNDNLGIGNQEGAKSRSVVSDWNSMYFAPAMDENDTEHTPRLGHAEGAKGTLRIFEDSNWDNLYVGFIPDGYKLKFGDDEYAFAMHNEGDREYRSEVVLYNSTKTDKNVSVGVVGADGKYVVTNHTQEMRHIFLKDNCGWRNDGAKLAIYYWGVSEGWCGFLKTVPGDETLFEGWIPSNVTNLKFVRFSDTKGSVGNWDDKWNETGDLAITTEQNLFTMTEFSNGTWSAYERYGQFAMHDNSKSKNWYVHFVPHYVLTYDENATDATGEMDVQTVAVDAANKGVVVANCGFTRPGYRFIKWRKGTTSTYYVPNGSNSIELNADITLYAVWEKEYTVTYNANGGTTTCEDNNAYIKGETVTVCDKVPTKTGYTFDGWLRSDNGEKVKEGESFTMPANDVTLTAQWIINKYTVTLNPNYPAGKTGTFIDKDGNTIDGNLVLTYDYNTSSKTLTDLYQSIKLDGYRFDGWYSAKGASDGTVSGSKWSETGNITRDLNFYAQWTEVDCRWIETDIANILPDDEVVVTMQIINSNGEIAYQALGTETITNSPKSQGVNVTSGVINPADNSEFEFSKYSWSISTVTGGYTLQPYGMSGIYLYGMPSYISIGNNTENNVFLIYASPENDNKCFAYVRDKAYFVGYGMEDGNGAWKRFTSYQSVLNNQTLKFYKRVCVDESNPWCIVTFNAGSGSCDTESLTGTKNEGIILPTATPSEACKDEWTFAGWATTSVTETTTAPTLLLADDNYKPDSNHTLYAVYSKKETDEGGGAIEEVSKVYTFSNYTAGTQYAQNEQHVLDENVTLITTQCHFTSELRIYSSDEHNGYVVSNKLPGRIVSIKINAGNKSDNVLVDGSTDGSTWANVGSIAVSSTSYNDYTLDFGETNYTYFKLDVEGANQVRLKSITITWESVESGGSTTVTIYDSNPDCATYTLIFNDRGVETSDEYSAGYQVPQPADPTDVCTEPIEYVFDGWAKAEITAENVTSYEKVTFPFTMPAESTTLYAVYRYVEEGSGDSGDYVKLTEDLDDYSGDYLIVYEAGTVAFNGGLDELDETSNTIAVTISSNTIKSNATTDAAKFTIAKVDDGYSIQSASGYYIGWGGEKNGLNTNSSYTVAYLNTISNNTICGKTGYLKFNKTSGQERFRYYQSGQETIALYRKAASYLYTTSPVCGPHLVITEGKEIYVTGGNAGGTRDLVIAQQKVSYKATRLQTSNGLADGTAPDVKVATNGITVGGVVTSDVKVTIDQTKEQQTDGTYTITGTVTVQYQPSAKDKQEDIQVQLAVDYNTEAKDNFIVHARSLPSEFVIVAKSGDKWYALNGDMNNGSSANPANGQVTLDDDANPTKATYAPCNTIYTFDGVPNTGDRTRVRFQGTDGAWLWAASGTNVGIQNKSLKDTPEGDNKAYNWKLETEDNITYKFHNDNSSRLLGLSGEKFGMYASAVQELRILPYVEKCLYNYAPSNLIVKELKGSYVVLTWDAVVGATKYQYSTDATTWTDAGTEPTVTINGLTGDTEYTYYIRAYHEDAGVSQECIDYAEITFTTADCDDVPTNITYTADLNSITISWTAAAPTATIKLFMNEDGTGGGGTYPGATSPYTISGGLDKNTTYYIQILSDGTCASPIIPVKTEDVELDIVEWKTDGIVVDINTNETVGVTLENEVSYGTGLGTEATELFFSKYYEASYNVKLVAVYNGTKNIIDLTDYTIQYGKTSWESNYITLKDFGETKGQIQPGEEIILYSYAENNADDKKILDCVHDAFPDGNWVRVTSSNNTGKGTLSFGGDKTIILCKTEYDDETDEYYDNIIDVIGALKDDPNDGILPTNENTEKPSWGDKEGWVCETGVSIADDSQLGISTNRCLLIRNNTVTSGENAVAQNIGDFVTLCSEWKGAQVPDSDVDNGVAASCENFAYVGTFDYSDYYTKYVPMGEGTTFDENARNADGTVTISITDLYKHACSNIRVKLTNSVGEVLTDREYKVPIMITSDQTTAGQAFLELQENLATVEVDGNGNVINTYPLTLDEVREICKTCDVVIRDNATLTKALDDDTNDHPQVNNVMIYEGASLEIPSGADYNYTINSLSLRRKGDIVASAKVEEGGKLHLPASATAPIYLDMRIDAKNWHWFTLPYNCNIADVTWVDGTPAQYNKDWFIMYYDGNSRANEQSIYENHWRVYNGTTIEAGKGYIVGIQGDITHPNHTFELRFPMATEVLTNEHIDKTVAVNAWGVDMDITPNKKGWNLVGNPYLDYYKTSENISFTGLSLIEYLGIDPVTGERLYQEGSNIPFLVSPKDGGWYEYQQELASDVEMMPFTAYFVQVGDPANESHTDGMELYAKFVPDHRGRMSLIRRTPQEVDGEQEPVIVRVEVANAKGESDKTTLIIDDRFTNEYEMNADFFKWFGDYYRRYTKPVLYSMGADHGKRAFNALSEQLAAQPVALGMFAAQAGDYTFSLTRKRCDLSCVEEVWLYDATTATYTNLMQQDYTFTTAKTEGEGRFYLSVKMKQKTPTAVENVNGNLSLVAHQQTLVLSGLPAEAQVWVYDATGKLLHSEHTTAYQRIYPVQQAGVYFVSVKGQGDAQTLSTIVK